MTERESLQNLMRAVDGEAQSLESDERCEWVRSRFGIIGRVSLSEKVPVESLDQRLRELVDHAYGVIDQVPDAVLGFEDLWSLLLLICVPWSRNEVASSPRLAEIFAGYSRETTGSRKVIVLAGEPIQDLFAPLGTGPSAWMPPPGDPLHEAINAVAHDEAERDALEIVFRRRITEDEIDALIRVLGRTAQR